MTARPRPAAKKRRHLVVAAAAASVLLMAGCTAAEPPLTEAQARSARLSASQIETLGGEASSYTDPGAFTAGDLAALAFSPATVDPESCRGFVTSLTVPGPLIDATADAESADPIVIATHLDLHPGFVEQTFRVLPDAAAAEALLADLRTAADACEAYSYGTADNVNRFDTVTTGELPFDAEGYVATREVSGTEVVVETDEIYAMRFDNVVAVVRGSAGSVEPFAQAVADNFAALR